MLGTAAERLPSILGNDGDVSLLICWPVELEERDDASPRSDCLLGLNATFVGLGLTEVTDKPVAQLPLPCFDRLTLVFPGLHRVVAWTRKARPEQRQAHANRACVGKVDVLDVFGITEPVPKLFKRHAIGIGKMHTQDCERHFHFELPDRAAGHGHFSRQTWTRRAAAFRFNWAGVKRCRPQRDSSQNVSGFGVLDLAL